ncbi:MAG: cytochrome c biogenesis CcdA family protein [Aggregatilineales bacterium]
MINVTAWLAFLAGFLSFISPCVLPLVPPYVAYIGNRITAQIATGTGPLQDSSARRFQMALHGLTFVAGFTLVFVVFGLAITAGTRVLSATFYDVQRMIIPRVGGILIVLFGLHFLGLVVPTLHWLECYTPLERLGTIGLRLKTGLAWLQSALYADTRRRLRFRRNNGLIGSGLMGIIFAAGWTPCIGPIYGTILTMAASGGSVFQAGGLMLVYSLGLGIPFIVTAALLDRIQGILRQLKRCLPVIKVASGTLLVAIGVLVFTGELQRFSQFGATTATFSYTMEECAVNVSNGQLALSALPDCLSKP